MDRDRLERGKERRFLYAIELNLKLLDATMSELAVDSYNNHEVTFEYHMRAMIKAVKCFIR